MLANSVCFVGDNMIDDEKLIIDRVLDLVSMCERKCEACFSDFLDGAKMRLIQEKCFVSGLNFEFFGGFLDAERKMLGVFPEWEEPNGFPISLLEVTHNFGGELSHRDYLGSLMGLGIDRKKTGDILIDKNTAYIFVTESVSSYISENLTKIGSRGVKVKIRDIADAVIPEKKFLMINSVCASLRLDALVGAAANISRSKATELILAGLVKLNHKEEETPSKQVSEGDLLSVRGYGRFVLCEAGGETRKGRIHIVLKKYI